MATYVINDGYPGYRTIEADSYRVDERFVHFVDTNGEYVLTIQSSNVVAIERK